MRKTRADGDIPSSFRDPSGHLFYQGGSIYRQINLSYKDNYDHLINSGLYEALVDAGLLIPHSEAEIEADRSEKVYKIIKPEKILFISYPYEWCFSQLKDASLTTLRIQKESLKFGMSLKDCSAFNIQFRKGKPILIDTLSFEKYREEQPWVAYRQFCQHFLAPLTLMSYVDVRLSQLLRVYLDGLPLDLTSSLLPFSTRFIFSLLTHIHLHARSQRYFADKTIKKPDRKMGNLSFLGLVDSLEQAVSRLKWQPKGTEWADYYEDTNYSLEALNQKKELVSKFLEKDKPGLVWDLGSNTGLFSRVATDMGMEIISFDIDPACVERNYIDCLRMGQTRTLPLLLDLTNPSPGIGWGNQERMSIMERGPADAVLGLALIHHLAIANNLPLSKIAEMFSRMCQSLLIEFVPKSDSQVQRLLSMRNDIFPNYTQKSFEEEFGRYFIVQDSVKLEGSERILYSMARKKEI